MRLLIQRVNKAQVTVENKIVGKIQQGLCVFVGIAANDTAAVLEKMANKLVQLRIFEDPAGKMNLSLLDVAGQALLVSQFTLLADCSKGRRPAFIGAGDPQKAEELYKHFCKMVAATGIAVQTGIFAADMTVLIENDGPCTFWLDSEK
ncbi:MAG: D-tyrosyl-tRNA(Tyr) deacylase [Alphaproteobacteria bacterium]|nr:D-tyrosyl-tRNA(Tyr) deacylase [Alphaproteobacteria bacterium]